MQPRRSLGVEHERFAIRGGFTISRGSRSHADVVLATIREGAAAGRGECVPYARYGEGIASVVAQIETARAGIEAGLDRRWLDAALPPGAARNALDAALVDLEAEMRGVAAHDLLGLAPPAAVLTAFTLSLGAPEAMAEAALAAAGRPLLKLKLGGAGDVERVQAVRAAVPGARLIVDANEAWSADQLAPFMAAMAEMGVELIEQPLPAGADAALAALPHPVPVGADESVHATADLAQLRDRYEVVNLKLDKAGGLMEAMRFVAEAERQGFGLMIGCMLGTSLGVAPALLLAQGARFVDLDGPLLLAEDRTPALRAEGSLLFPAEPALWG